MNEVVPVRKDENEEQSVPILWRGTLATIVDLIRKSRFDFNRRCSSISSVAPQVASNTLANIKAYEGELVSLPEKTWETSVARWNGGHWQVLVDLSTTEESPSDLVLFVKVFEEGQSYRFEVDSVHVP